MRAEVYPVCRQCGQVPRYGLFDGFRIHGNFFCTECQERLLSAEIGSPFYLAMAAGLKEALRQKRGG
ncbi:inhibitor of sigma-G Gin [Peptococcaceae bacterium CEB3]|nr:inhibitor of sigma-G Gin [Peptococcaceae bacterium CEB3]